MGELLPCPETWTHTFLNTRVSSVELAAVRTAQAQCVEDPAQSKHSTLTGGKLAKTPGIKISETESFREPPESHFDGSLSLWSYLKTWWA